MNFDPKIVEVYLSLLLKPVYRELANEQTIGKCLYMSHVRC